MLNLANGFMAGELIVYRDRDVPLSGEGPRWFSLQLNRILIKGQQVCGQGPGSHAESRELLESTSGRES